MIFISPLTLRCRPESDSCTALQHCRASLELRLAALRGEVSSEVAGGELDEAAGKIRQLENVLQQVILLIQAVYFVSLCPRQCVDLYRSGRRFLRSAPHKQVRFHRLLLVQVHGQKHASSEDAVAAALASLEQLRSVGTAGDGVGSLHQRNLVLVEVQCEHGSSSSGDRDSADADRGDQEGQHGYGDGSDHDGGGWEDQGRDSLEDGGSYGDDAHAAESGTRRSGKGPAWPLTGLARVDDQVRRLYEAAAPGTLLLVVTQGSMVAMKLLASQKMR
jgi:hypothetical protein